MIRSGLYLALHVVSNKEYKMSVIEKPAKTLEQMKEAIRLNREIEMQLASTIVEISAPQKGAEWLDENEPGWADSINLDYFDIRIGSACVCGQVFDNNEQDGWSYFENTYGLEKARELGFTTKKEIPIRAEENEWDHLQREWEHLIRERQT
jgi:hypothetical protein